MIADRNLNGFGGVRRNLNGFWWGEAQFEWVLMEWGANQKKKVVSRILKLSAHAKKRLKNEHSLVDSRASRLLLFFVNKLNPTTHQYDSPTETRVMPECMFNQIRNHSL
jgi:hypothetical protein